MCLGQVRKPERVGEFKLGFQKVFQLMSYWVIFKVVNVAALMFSLFGIEVNW